MRTASLPTFIRRAHLIAAASLTVFSTTAHSGILANNVPVQTYRDFAENRGIFQPGATNVSVTDNNGAVIGTVNRVMNFDSVTDTGWSSLVGGPGFMATVSHNNATDVTFTSRFGGGTGTAFASKYHFVAYNRGWGTNSNTYEYDYATPRLNKIVTEAVAINYLTDTAILANLKDQQVLRVGAGTQAVVTPSGTGNTTLIGAYNYLTGGTINFKSVSIGVPNDGTPLPANTATATYHYNTVDTSPASAYLTYNFSSNNLAPSATFPLDIGVLPGDSGSSSWYYNTTNSRWEYVAAAQSGSLGGYNSGNYYRSGFQFATNVIDAYNVNVTPLAGGGNITINAPSAGSTAATITQTGMTTVNFVSLANDVNGATASGYTAAGTAMTAATDAEMNATNNLTFGATGGTLVVNGDIDLGSGFITFNGDYTITGSRMNSAGYDIKAGAVVTSRITGLATNTGANIPTGDWRYNIATTTIARDEWRKVGDGKLIIEGNGNNEADLNIGGGGIVELNRAGGYGAYNVLINGGAATLKLVGANQLGGVMVFGHRGGTLDLYGHAQTWSDILHMDSGARITNTLANNSTTFTFAGTGAKAFLGGFTDSGSLANGRLKLVYSGGTGNTWNLSGNITNTGGFDIGANGTVNVGATTTLHAGGYVDTTDYVATTFNTGAGTVNLATGSTLAFGRKTTATGNFAVADTATLKIATSGGTLSNAAQGTTDGTTVSGTVALNGANAKIVADVATGFTSTLAATVSGNGKLQKDGVGTLAITGTNTFSGGGLINAGTVTANANAALGAGANNWTIGNAGVLAITGANTATALGKIATTSTGTLALTTGDTAPGALTGFNTLYVGATGASPVAYGAAGSDITAVNGGWRLGGGGGELRVDGRLAGANTLYVGNGYSTGVVTLTNTLNNFTGGITLGGGVDLRYSDILALGGSNLNINYGASASLGATPTALLAKVAGTSAGYVTVDNGTTLATALDFTGKNSLSLGVTAGGAATYSGTITPGTAGYRFGGQGQLTVSSTLTGANGVIVDGQNYTTGMVTLTGANNFTGGVTVRGYDSTITPTGTGAVTLKLGSASALGATSGLTLQNNATLDLGGYSLAFSTFAGDTSSRLINSAAADSTITANIAADTTLGYTLATTGTGRLNLIKNGAATLTIAGSDTHIGTHTVNSGILKLGSANALGKSASTVVVAAGAAFDLNGFTAVDQTQSALPESAQVTLSGTGIAGGGALLNTGASKAKVKSITLAADTTISVGAQQIIIGTAAKDGSVTLAGNTLTKTGTGTLVFNGMSLTGAGNIVVNAGTLQLTTDYTPGADDQRNVSITGTGNITINAGATLNIPRFAPTLTMTMPIVLNGGTLGSVWAGPNNATIASPITLSAGTNNTFQFVGGYDSVTLSGVISGSGNLSITGAYPSYGTRTFTGINTYTGNTTLSASAGATLTIGGAGQLGAGNYVGTLTLGSGNTFKYASTADQILSGAVGGAGTLQVDSGKLTLAADNTHSGATTVNGGTLQIGNGGATGTLGSGAVTNAGTLIVNRTGTLTIANAIAGAGTLTQAGAGSTILTGASTYTGATTVSSGTLQIGAGATTGSIDSTSGITVSGSGTLALNRSDAVTFDRVIAGTGHFSKLGANTVTLTGANTYSGTTTVAGGVLNVGAGGTTGAIGTGAVTNNGSIVFNRSDAYTVAGAISGTGSVTQSGQGTLTLAGLGDYSGTTTVNAGTLRVTGGTTGTGAVAIASGTTLAGSGTLGGIVTLASGATLQNTQGSTLTMGGLVLNATSLIEADLSTPGGNALFQVNGNLTLDGSVHLTTPLSLAGTYRLINYTGTLTDNGLTVANGGGLVSVSSAVAGQINLANLGTAIAYWDGANTTANALIEGGTATWTTLGTNWTNALGDTNGVMTPAPGFAIFTGTAGTVTVSNTGGQVTVNGMQFARSGYTVTGGNVALVNNADTGYAALRVGDGTTDGAGYTATIASGLTGSGVNIHKTDLGTLILTGTNTYTGTTFVDAGTLQIGSGVINGTLGTGAVSIANNATLAFKRAGSYIVTNTISGAGSLSQIGSGTLALAADNTYSGGTTIASGTLQVGNDGTTGSLGSGAVVNNGTLAFNRITNPVTVANAISGTGALQQNRNNTLILTGNNTYTGTTTISSGILQIGNAGTSGTLGSGAVINNGALSFNRSDAITVANAISGNGASTLTQSGTGTLILTGTNTYTGATNISSGILQIGNGGTAGSLGNTAIANAGSLVINRSGSLTLGGVISGAGTLVHNGTGTTTLTAGNTYTGATTVNDGRLLINGAFANTAVTVKAGAGFGGSGTKSNGNIVFDNNSIVLASASNATAKLTLTNGTASFGTGTLVDFANAPVIGTSYTVIDAKTAFTGFANLRRAVRGSLTQSSAGNRNQITVSASSLNVPLTWTGTTDGSWAVNEGTKNNFKQTSAGSADNFYSFDTVTFDDSASITNVVLTGQLNVSGITFDNTAKDYVLTGTGQTIGSGALTKTGTGRVTLAADNYYAGTTTISAGTLQIGNGGTAGTLGLGAVVNNAALEFNRADTLTVANAISGTGSLTQNGAATLVLSGTNTYTGATAVNAGTLQLGSAGAFNGAGALAIGTGATFDANGYAFSTSALTGGGALALGSATVTLNNAATTEFSGVISGTGALTKTGAGTQILSGNNTYTGTTTISAGTLRLGNGGNGGALASAAVVNNAALVVNRADSSTLAAAISGSGTFTQAGAGTTVLTGTNTYAGGTLISAGTLQIGDGGTAGTLAAGTVVNHGTLAFNRSDAVTLALAVSGSGALTQAGSGILTLTADNTYAGTTTIAAGTLRLGNGGTTGALGAGDIVDNGALVINRTDAVTLANAISGSGSLAQSGAGTTTLTGANAFTGGVTVNAGVLRLGASGALGSANTLAINTGTFDANGYDFTATGLTGSGSLTLGTATATVNAAADSAFNGAITGTGGLVKSGAGALTLSGTNGYTGATAVNAGTLRLGSASAYNGAGTLAIASGATFDAAGYAFSTSSLSGSGALSLGSATATVNAAGADTFAGVISGSGSLVKSGSGTLALAGANTHTGGTTLNTGTLALNHASALGSGALVINGGTIDNTSAGAITLSTNNAQTWASDFTFAGTRSLNLGNGLVSLGSAARTVTVSANTLTVGGMIFGSGSLVKSGEGTLTLSGTNTYAGGTTVAAGTLQVSGSVAWNGGNTVALGTGPLTVESTGTVRNLSSHAIWGGNTNTRSVTLNGGTIDISGGQEYFHSLNMTGGLVTRGVTTNLLRIGVNAGGATITTNASAATATISTKVDMTFGSLTTVVADGAAATDLLISGVISENTDAGSGAKSLTKSGAGTLALSGTNTYTGTTTITAGALTLSGAGTLGAGTYAGAIANDGILTHDSSSAQTLSGVISGTGSLVKSGSGTLTLAGATNNTYSGDTTLSGGTLQVNITGALGTGTLTLAGGTLQPGAATTIANNLIVQTGTTTNLIGAGSGDLRYSGNATGSGTLNLNSTVSRSVWLQGDWSAYTGTINVTVNTTGTNYRLGGTLGQSFVGTGTNGSDFSQAKFVLAGTGTDRALAWCGAAGTTVQLGELSGTGGRIDIATSNSTAANWQVGALNTSTTFAGVIAGTGTALTKVGSGTLTLTGANTYTGGTTVNAGKLVLDNGTANGTTRIQGALTINAGGTVETTGDATGLGWIGQISSLTINGGTVTTSGKMHVWGITGGITMTGGTLQSNNGVNQAGNAADGGQLEWNKTTVTTLASSATATIAGRINIRTDNTETGITCNVADGTAATDLLISAGIGQSGGTMALTKTGTGLLTLSGTNTYTGGTNIQNGTLQLTGALSTSSTLNLGNGTTSGKLILGDATAAKSQTVAGLTSTGTGTANAIVGGGNAAVSTLNVNLASGSNTFAGTLGGAGPNENAVALTKSGAGTLILTGANTYTGGTTVTAGTLTFANGSLGTSGAITVNGGTLQWATGNTQDISSRLTLVNATTATLDTNGNAVAFASAFGASTTGPLVKIGSGTLTLSGTNTYTGGTTITAGTLAFANGSLGTAGAIAMNGGTLQWASGNTQDISSRLTLQTGKIATLDTNGNTVTLATAFGGGTTASLTKTGAGTLTLSAANTYTGGTTLAAGTLSVGNATALGSGSVSVTGNATLTHTVGFANAIDIAATKTLTLGSNTYTGAVSGVISGSGQVTVNNNIVLSGTNTFLGNFTGTNGFITVTKDAAFGAATNSIAYTGGFISTYTAGAAVNLTRNIAITNTIGLDANGQTLSLAGVISGTGGISTSGTHGTAVFSGANTYSGATTIGTGTISINSIENVGSANASALGQVTTIANGTISIGTGNTTATLRYTGAGSTTDRVINLAGTTGGAILDQSGTGLLKFTSALTATGGGSKTLTLTGSTAGTGEISGAIVDNSATTRTALTKTGTGTWILSGTNTYTGVTTLSAGVLSLDTLGNGGVAGNLGAATATATNLVFDGGTLKYTGVAAISDRAFTINATKTATIETVGNLTLAGATGTAIAGALVKTGAGTLTLTGANSYTGATTVNAGKLQIDTAAGTLAGTSGITINNGGTLEFMGTIANRDSVGASNKAITVATGGTLLVSTANAMGYNAQGNMANVTLNGGTFTLNADQYVNNLTLGATGGTVNGAGNLYLYQETGNAITANASNTLANGIVFYSGASQTNNHTVTVATGATLGITGSIGRAGTGTGGLIKSGAGTLTLSGSNSYNGTTTVNAGTLVAGHSSAFGTGAVTVNNGGTLNTGLAGSNLTLGNAITVNAGGRIMGAGTLNSALTLNGTIAPGNSPGTLTLNAGGTFGATSVTEWEFVGDTLATGGVDFDRILVTGGTLTINSGATFKFVATGVDYTNALWDTDRTFLVVDASGTGNSTGSYVLDTSLAGNFAAEGSWSLVRSGGDVLAKWTGGAIPEPSEYGLMGAGALAAISLIRRRRRKLAA